MRKAFSAFTFVLLGLCVWTIFANILSDDTELRARAAELAKKAAGCGEKCKAVAMSSERGMIHETVECTFESIGKFVVECRRTYVIAGDYECNASRAP